MQKWLARFSFSFLILAAFMAWEAYRMIAGRVPMVPVRLTLLCIGTGVCAALAGAGIRARHRDQM
jgi:hypothetical protein